MSGNSTVDREIAALKRKLDIAIESRSAIDDEFKFQTTLFTEFIIKLSQASKGTDLSLDNKLAKLRLLFTKSAPIAEVQKLVKEITLLLQKFSLKKEQEIINLQSEFNLAGQALQKIKGLPEDLRRQLRTLLKDNEETKEALAQYIPLLTQLVNFYQIALKKDNVASSTGGLLNQPKTPTAANIVSVPDQKIIKRFTEFLTKINVSRQYQNQLLKIKAELNENMPNEKLLNSFLAAFDVISHDLVHERNTAKVFLSTLSETLSTIQTAVKSTITTQEKCHKKNQKLNTQLQNQINNMAHGLDQANSLVDIKVDISGKLEAIVNTLDEKALLENTLQLELEKKLVDMQAKIEKLEEQSITFEKRIQEQQAKSLQDALTKLNNRAAFDEYFAKETVRYQHNGGLLSIAIADLDNFKRINDTYGHTAGDKTLQVLASTFKKHLENDAFIARYGGEEFIFIFRDKSKSEVNEILNSLRANIAKLPFKFKDNKVSMTLSIGVTHIKTDDNVHIAFERADTALYKAKEEGKNRVIYIE
ncbi:diguanylate cyclase [Colwellia sp. 1_MG-2023]|uniref:GGDEF domain-containing protein n=1 Tax=Colwellia sp. 1_MG-2023 TaxID=3062649 RepID=UPI0026E1BF10|nr:GGDEF domain-containing protein [Colwellia sp. 1_MG-2023]MDO6446432.1 diguanylate cyclase [Colwellia sp. 1_MG-2023]